MTSHEIGTREQWLKARLELLQAEKELTRRSDELARRRQELPWVRVDKEYRFETDEGSASLADLFRGRSQLVLDHRGAATRGGHRIQLPARGAAAGCRDSLAGETRRRCQGRGHDRHRRGHPTRARGQA